MGICTSLLPQRNAFHDDDPMDVEVVEEAAFVVPVLSVKPPTHADAEDSENSADDEAEEDSLEYSESSSEGVPRIINPMRVAQAISMWRKCRLRKFLPETFFFAVNLLWRYEETMPPQMRSSASIEDACLLMAVKFVESIDREVPGLATRSVIAAEALIATRLNWRIWRRTLFDRIGESTKSEPTLQITRLAAGAVMVGSSTVAIEGGVEMPEAQKLARVSIVMHHHDVVRVWRGRLVLAIRGDFLSDAPFHPPKRVFTDAGCGEIVRAVARRSPVGTDLDLLDPFAAPRLASKSLIWWSEE